MAKEERKFSWFLHTELQRTEWLQYVADDFSILADLWDEYKSDYFEKQFEYYKEDQPDIGKMEMYEDVAYSVGASLLHVYVHDSGDISIEIERVRESLIKFFEDCVIFPNLLKAIGIIQDVKGEARFSEYDFYSSLYFCLCSTPEEAKERFDERAGEKFDKERKLTEEDYEDAFGCITEFLAKLEKGQYSEKLRESAWAIKGYCKLKVGSEKYAKIEAEIAKTKNRPTQAEMKSRELKVREATNEYHDRYGRKPTAKEIADKTPYTVPQIRATSTYIIDNKIKKSSGTTKRTFDTVGDSVTPSEQFSGTSELACRTHRLSKANEAIRDKLIDESLADDAQDEKQHKRYLKNKNKTEEF